MLRKDLLLTTPLVTLLVSSFFLYSIFNNFRYHKFHTFIFPVNVTSDSKIINSHKKILIWNSPHRLETAPFGTGHKPFVDHQCKISDCTLYVNRSALPLEDFDAIVMNIHELFHTLPSNYTRPAQQRWVFLDHEPAQFMHENLKTLEGLFNWTMTYRLNSDIRLLYGYVEPLPSAPQSLVEFDALVSAARHVNPVSNKNCTKSVSNQTFVAWFASNCRTDSRREKYVENLRKYINIDIYGACGNLSCPRNGLTWLSNFECYEMLEQKYKFYLSFENSRCTDYVTEKFFYVLNRTIVPVVYGGANYSRIAPPHSYINAMDYTPKALAEYLHFLNENENSYIEYFWWKEHYKLHVGFDVLVAEAFCELCAKLHTNQTETIHRDLEQEWDPKYQCW